MSELKVFGYARVSTENQLDNYSIDEQVSRIRSYCAARNWELLRTFVDGGYSGGNTHRPALGEMRAAIRAGTADAVVVCKLDRLSRSQKDTLTLIEDEFLTHHTDFISINENFDTSTPFGRAMIGILSVFAQLEKDQITERFTMGRIGRSKAGYYHGGPTPPTGYDYLNGELVVNPLTSRQVREIFDTFIGGGSIHAIGRRMEAQYGGNWSASKIAGILRNSVYIGKVKFRGIAYPGRQPPLIEAERFEAVQQLLKNRPAALRPPFRAGCLLSGIVYCGRCGARYSANHGCYKCYSRAKSSRRMVRDPSCQNENWKIETLDRLVSSAVQALCGEQAADLKPRCRTDVDQSGIQRRISALDRRMERLTELFRDSSIPLETLHAKVRELRDEQTALRHMLEERHPAVQPHSCADFSGKFDLAPLEIRRALVDSLIERIELDGSRVRIRFRV
jgi:site-specific DNA recombinase